jgi:hypothetical protein
MCGPLRLDTDRIYPRPHIPSICPGRMEEEPDLGRGWEIRNRRDGRTTQSIYIMGVNQRGNIWIPDRCASGGRQPRQHTTLQAR